MEKKTVVSYEVTAVGVFISCPVCRGKKLLRLYPGTSATELPVFCRRCKRVSVLNIQPGEQANRVTLQRIG